MQVCADVGSVVIVGIDDPPVYPFTMQSMHDVLVGSRVSSLVVIILNNT